MLSNYWDNKNNQSVNKMGEGKRGYWEERQREDRKDNNQQRR